MRKSTVLGAHVTVLHIILAMWLYLHQNHPQRLNLAGGLDAALWAF